MSLKELKIKKEYRSLLNDIARTFFIPTLSEGVEYNRAVGFFSSSILVDISKGISGLVKNKGKIRLVASPYLSDEDISAIKCGYLRRDQVIKDALRRELHQPDSEFEAARLNLLANLIADGIMDIKIAFTEDAEQVGMYHEKMGIITDSVGNKIAFSGSLNESLRALRLNYETIDVFCSWKGEEERVNTKESAFTAIWNNSEPNIRIVDFPELSNEIIAKYKYAKPDLQIDEEEFKLGNNHIKSGDLCINNSPNSPQIPENLNFYQYQLEAIEEWARKGYRGIFDMATGTGKTYTGLGAITKLAKHLQNKLAVVIVCPYQHLVEQWVEDIKKFNIKPIIGYSASAQKNWKEKLSNAILGQKLNVIGKNFFCFICTNATFSSEYVQEQLSKIRDDSLLMIDEAHYFGAPCLNKLMLDSYKYRLALSATLDRYNDEKGTQALYHFFGEKCIEYTLERAIKEKKLTPYKYYPIVVALTDKELEIYDQLSLEIAKCCIKGKNGEKNLSEKGKRLAIQRARLVAGAEEKLSALEVQIRPYLHSNHILVYCGATKGLEPDQDVSEISELDRRQIKRVTALLGNKLGMSVARFTSEENVRERANLKIKFTEGDPLQVLIAIKCLDEGVNIPSIKTAFILSSTTNPKEYIQRRGRVLRLAEGKEYAEIFDFITLPHPLNLISTLSDQKLKKSIGLVKNELRRVEEFSRMAVNFVSVEKTIDDIKDAYGIKDYLFTFEKGEVFNG